MSVRLLGHGDGSIVPPVDGDTSPEWLLVSDIDDTLVGDDEALREFVEALDHSPRLHLALNSSRPRESVGRTLAALPVRVQPCALITAMGTQVAIGGEPDEAWAERFAGWSRDPIDRVMADLGFTPHAEQMQTPLKASYAVPHGADQARAREALRAAGVEAQIIASGASDLDVLPPGADKGAATRYVAERLAVDAAHLVVAGDSANDLSMFAVAAKGIVVGNARPELRDAVDPARVCFAAGRCAGGLIEGLRYWHAPLTPGHHCEKELT